MTRVLLVSVTLLFAVGCGGDDCVRSSCKRIYSTICNKYVECHVTADGTLFTSALCSSAIERITDGCVQKDGANIEAATDATVNECVQGLAGTPCSSLCGQVAQDPPACAAIDPEPNTDVITCE